MAGLREATRSVRHMPLAQLPRPCASICSRRFATTDATPSTPETGAEIPISAEEEAPKKYYVKKRLRRHLKDARGVEYKKDYYERPGPKHPRFSMLYYRGPLHPFQPPPESEPIARNFRPGPFNLPRLKQTFQSTIASDIMTLAYIHKPPGTEERRYGQRLRSWEGDSPYFKNRPLREPRGDPVLRPVERDITFRNVPEIMSVTVASYVPKACQDPNLNVAARAAVLAVTGVVPESVHVKTSNTQWRVQAGKEAGAKAILRGHAAYEFLDKCINLVLPRIKDWPGIKGTTGDSTGNLSFGLTGEDMALFPEIEANYSMFPSRTIPGVRIFVQTSAKSDRHARLLFQALGLPFYGKLRN